MLIFLLFVISGYAQDIENDIDFSKRVYVTGKDINIKPVKRLSADGILDLYKDCGPYEDWVQPKALSGASLDIGAGIWSGSRLKQCQKIISKRPNSRAAYKAYEAREIRAIVLGAAVVDLGLRLYVCSNGKDPGIFPIGTGALSVLKRKPKEELTIEYGDGDFTPFTDHYGFRGGENLVVQINSLIYSDKGHRYFPTSLGREILKEKPYYSDVNYLTAMNLGLSYSTFKEQRFRLKLFLRESNSKEMILLEEINRPLGFNDFKLNFDKIIVDGNALLKASNYFVSRPTVGTNKLLGKDLNLVVQIEDFDDPKLYKQIEIREFNIEKNCNYIEQVGDNRSNQFYMNNLELFHRISVSSESKHIHDNSNREVSTKVLEQVEEYLKESRQGKNQ